MVTTRPNVVFIITDQQQGQSLDPDSGFETPNFDQLASDGVQFTNSYCTHPQCSPSRASLVTSQYPHQTGVYTLSNWGPYELDPETPNIGRCFRNGSYETVWIGRWDLGAENITKLGWEFTRNVDVTGSPGRKGKARDDTTVTEAVRYIENYDGERPFFLTAAFNLPHPTFFEDEEFSHHYSRDRIELPESFSDDLETKPEFQQERAAELDLSPEEVTETRYRYRTMVSRVDSYVGRIINALRNAGIYDETIVVVTSDHGDMQGAHRLHKKGTVAYEEVLRVPLIVRIPGVADDGRVIDPPVSTISLPTTLLDAVGLEIPDAFEGESLLPLLAGRRSDGDEPIFFEHKYALSGEHPFRGIRTQEWKFVEYVADNTAELYKLRDDPNEMVNLADDPDPAERRDRLQQQLLEWWSETGGDNVDWTEPVSLPGRE